MTRRGCYPASPITLWRPARCATHWSPETGKPGWRRCARAKGSRVRTPLFCCRSCSRPQRRPRNVARGTLTIRVYGVTTRDTSTVTSARHRRTRALDVATTTKAPSTRCSKPCPNDKDQASKRKPRFGRAIWWTASYPDTGIA